MCVKINMRYFWLILIFFSLDVLAQGQVFVPSTNALSLAPPANDSSLVFLSNLFGVVDGVLAGTGSQIFPRMMAVFNSAILALGSIVFTYVLLMGTMHTAHEGEFLGRQWSSILIPLRTTFGLALLVPKASGYCIVQIFVMWVVVQGVGAADKIWNSALDYLSQGGKIVQQQIASSAVTSTSDNKKNPVYSGAISMLAGQVCMLGLENGIRKIQKNMPNLLGNKCNSDPAYTKFCNGTVPDFIGTFDSNSAQESADKYSIAMPYFPDPKADYYYLNGICGTIKWNKDSDSDTNTARKVAVQTMYSFLSNLAYTMIHNDPIFSNSVPTTTATVWAITQFGVPYQTGSTTVCNSSSENGCSSWGSLDTGAVLFTGNEFLNAVLAYTGTMAPILTYNQEKTSSDHDAATSFISNAKQNGWIFAGSYFFNLINLSGSAAAPSGTAIMDTSSGLNASTDPINDLSGLSSLSKKCQDPNPIPNSFCWIFRDNMYIIENILGLIQGANSPPSDFTPLLQVNSGNFTPANNEYYIVDQKGTCKSCLSAPPQAASTVYGFVGNSYFFQLKGQPPSGAISYNVDFPYNVMIPTLQNPFNWDPGCRGFLCIPGLVINILADLLSAVFDVFQIWFQQFYTIAIQLLLITPIKAFVIPLLQQAIKTLGDINNNPIVNLANMGAYFIQAAMNFWFSLAAIGALAIIPDVGIAVVILTGLFLPLISSWLAYFLSVGFTTAYYIPMLPYMIFIFGAIGWLFAVVESMIAAPIVALVMTTPEGEGVVGKGEHGLMILLNVFLRPSLMVLGFVSSIAISYVSIWILNSTFSQGAQFLQMNQFDSVNSSNWEQVIGYSSITGPNSNSSIAGLNWGQFPWAQIFGTLFYVTIYISMYVTLVQKSFTLIYNVPDKIMRWIGGTQESYGQETAEWVKGTEQQIEKFGEKTAGGIASGIGEYAKGVKDAIEQKQKADEQKKPPTGNIPT